MKLTIGISPCPNDTFIFDSFINNFSQAEGLELDVKMEDVETLNKWASDGLLDITKLSFPALFASLHTYQLLNSGAALGKGVGPLLIARTPMDPEHTTSKRIAIPGHHTTANFLLQFAFPAFQQKIPMLFSDIENAVLHKEADLGVIIHENRFTYMAKGLHKIADLGHIWENRMGLPVPLGGIAVRRSMDDKIKRLIDELICKSVQKSFDQYPHISNYVKMHANEMDEEVMRQHIDLYVNNFSINLGHDGREAIRKLYEVYMASNPDLVEHDTIFFDKEKQ